MTTTRTIVALAAALALGTACTSGEVEGEPGAEDAGPDTTSLDAEADATLDDATPDAPSDVGDGGADTAPTRHGPAMGTNLSGMEWAAPGLRYGQSTLPNLNFTVPRAADVAWLAANGYTKNRLPIQWELLQPMLNDTVANAAAKAAIGEPGAFDAKYESWITDVLDAHAAAGIKAIVDCHNYCRYQDFKYQSDGSVLGLTVPSNPMLRPYTTDGSQVQLRICALASGATLTRANLNDFWTRVAKKWKDHPGFGGYGLMNEPHEMPSAGGTVSSPGSEDLTIWPTFAQDAIDAIRAVDPKNPIYVGGNEWSSAMAVGTKNPGYPLKGDNLVYEVHMYLDASSAGYAFDYDTEVAKGYSAGLGSVPIDLDTGVNRLKIATAWAKDKGVKLALTEIGMPIDDVRWETMFRRAIDHAVAEDVEVYSWMGGAHWTIHNYALNHTPGFHQGKTLEPTVSGEMKAATGVASFALHDDGSGWAPSGSPATITVYARGNVPSPITLTVTASKGTPSKSKLVIPAGANGQDSYTFAPDADSMATLTYASDTPGVALPPPRNVYAFADPVARASTDEANAAAAILAKYGAAKWVMADGYTDYLQGKKAMPGDAVRAIADSGYGSTVGNAMEMLNWVNEKSAAPGTMALPILRDLSGHAYTDHRAPDTWGFWCKKSVPVPGVQPNPKNRVLYDLQDPHFVVAVVRVPTTTNSGVVFQASRAEESYASELRLEGGKPQAHWIDAGGKSVTLTSASALVANAPTVLSMTSTSGTQVLRVNASEVGRGSATFAASPFNQMLIGWGFVSYYPREGFAGDVFAVVAGKGTPTASELQILERSLAKTAGLTL